MARPLALPPLPRTEAGSGLLSTMVGVLVFLLLLLFAVQVTYNLYARSWVTAAAYDGARIAAGFDAQDDQEAEAAANAHIRRLLGAYGQRLDENSFEWSSDRDFTVLTLRVRNPGFLPSYLRSPMGIDTIERTVRIRNEREVGA